MEWVDGFFITLVIVMALLGMARGLMIELTIFLTWLFGLMGAFLFGPELAVYFQVGEISARMANIFAVITIFATIWFLGLLIQLFLKNTIANGLNIPDKLIGFFLGALKGFLLVLLLIFIVNHTTLSESDKWERSLIVSKVNPTLSNFMGDF